MKHFLFGCIAIILACASVAFTKEPRSPKAGSYWFALNATTGAQISQSTIPANSAPDPYSCPVNAPNFCSRQYSEYEVVPASSPVMYRGKAGTEGLTHKKTTNP